MWISKKLRSHLLAFEIRQVRSASPGDSWALVIIIIIIIITVMHTVTHRRSKPLSISSCRLTRAGPADVWWRHIRFRLRVSVSAPRVSVEAVAEQYNECDERDGRTENDRQQKPPARRPAGTATYHTYTHTPSCSYCTSDAAYRGHTGHAPLLNQDQYTSAEEHNKTRSDRRSQTSAEDRAATWRTQRGVSLRPRRLTVKNPG